MPTLAVLTKNRTNPAYVGARLGADRTASSFGFEVEHHVPEQPDDVGEQIELLRRAIATSPAAIVLAPAHEVLLGPMAEEAVREGIPLITIVSPLEGVTPLCHIGSDDVALGGALVSHIAEALGGCGRLVLVHGHPNATTSRLREQGMMVALTRHPGLSVARSLRGDYQRDAAASAFAQVLSDGVAFDGVAASNDFMALGVLDVLESAGRSTPVVGANATPQGVEAVKTGRMIGTAAFDAMSMAALAVEAAARHLRGERVPPVVSLPSEIVTLDRVAAWDMPYERRATTGWNEACGTGSPA